MPTISLKGQHMPSSPIRKLVPYAEEAKRRGTHVIHLNIGQPDIKTPEAVMEGIRNIDMEVIEYSHSAGFQSYRDGLIDYYASKGIGLVDGEVMVTTGGSEALLFAMQSCFDPGDEIIVPEPFYANYNGFAIASGVKIVPVTSHIEAGYALPMIQEFESLITDRTRGILICNPANPTGYLYSEAELRVLEQIVDAHDLFLIADEVYREFVYDGKEHFSCMSLDSIKENVILIDSVSKRYSMCGARIGALVSRNRDVMETAMKFAQARLSPPTLAQIAGELALDTPDSYFEAVAAEYVERRDILVDGLNGIDGVICPLPEGAFYCMARLPIDSADRFCQWILEEFDHDGYTVMMAPGSGFYATPGLGENEVRLAYVLERSALVKALEVLAHALDSYPGKIDLTDSGVVRTGN